MNSEPVLQKKKSFNILKTQYIYGILIVLVLIVGVAYALNFYKEYDEGLAGGLSSDLVSVQVSEEGVIHLENAVPVTDEDGLTGSSKTLTIQNTSNTNVKFKLKLNVDEGSTIPSSSMRYGLYLNGTLLNVDYVGPTDIIYETLLFKGETINLEVYLWIDYYFDQENVSFSGRFEIEANSMDMLGTEYISSLVNKNKGLYQISANEYRYSGNDVDNYVWFNCEEGSTSGSDNCELWRIIGSFNIKENNTANNYQRLKIVRNDSLSNQTFGASNVYSTSTINTYLNNTYYSELNESAKKMIKNSNWNVGSTTLTNTPSASLTAESQTKVSTKIGLISASDFGYSASEANHNKALNNSLVYTTSWLKTGSYYTITPSTSGNVVGNNGSGIVSLSVGTSSGIKPSVYLSPSVSIIGGSGTIERPYELGDIS